MPNRQGNEDMPISIPLPLFMPNIIHEFGMHDYTNFCFMEQPGCLADNVSEKKGVLIFLTMPG